jgi:hypothetical protein
MAAFVCNNWTRMAINNSVSWTVVLLLGMPATLLAADAPVDAKGGSAQYKEVLTLARGYDKAGRTSEAVEAYRKLLDVTPADSSAYEIRSVRAEAEKRLKALDRVSGKVDALIEEIMKKIDPLEKEAISVKNATAFVKLARLKVGLLRAQGLVDVCVADVNAKGGWQATGIVLRKGQTYRVRAAGTWRVSQTDGGVCGADGTDSLPSFDNQKIGTLGGAVEGAPRWLPLGSNVTFVAPVSGQLLLACHDPKKDDNSGVLQVIVEPAGD